jgi:hypothetical protein
MRLYITWEYHEAANGRIRSIATISSLYERLMLGHLESLAPQFFMDRLTTILTNSPELVSGKRVNRIAYPLKCYLVSHSNTDLSAYINLHDNRCGDQSHCFGLRLSTSMGIFPVFVYPNCELSSCSRAHSLFRISSIMLALSTRTPSFSGLFSSLIPNTLILTLPFFSSSSPRMTASGTPADSACLNC